MIGGTPSISGSTSVSPNSPSRCMISCTSISVRQADQNCSRLACRISTNSGGVNGTTLDWVQTKTRIRSSPCITQPYSIAL